MQIQIYTRGFTLTDGLKNHTEAKILQAFQRLAHNIHKIVIRLEDINGPRGGIDKRCSIQLYPKNSTIIVLASLHSEMYTAIDTSIDKTRQRLTQKIKRILALTKKPGKAPLENQDQNND